MLNHKLTLDQFIKQYQIVKLEKTFFSRREKYIVNCQLGIAGTILWCEDCPLKKWADDHNKQPLKGGERCVDDFKEVQRIQKIKNNIDKWKSL